MPAHFLDIAGKIADLKDILKEYEDALDEAEREGNASAAERYRRLIKEAENKIDGMRKSPYYNG